MEKWTQDQITKEVELRADKMEDIVIARSVKEGVAGLSMMMECCFAAAKGVKTKQTRELPVMGTCAGGGHAGEVKEIALALFDAMVKQSLMATTQQAQQSVQIADIRGLMSKS